MKRNNEMHGITLKAKRYFQLFLRILLFYDIFFQNSEHLKLFFRLLPLTIIIYLYTIYKARSSGLTDFSKSNRNPDESPTSLGFLTALLLRKAE